MQQATPPIEVHTIAGCTFELAAPVIKALELHKGLEIGCIPLSFKVRMSWVNPGKDADMELDPDQPNFRLGTYSSSAFDAMYVSHLRICIYYSADP